MDLEEMQWQVIKKIVNLQERKRKYDLHEIWTTISYLVIGVASGVCYLAILLFGNYYL